MVFWASDSVLTFKPTLGCTVHVPSLARKNPGFHSHYLLGLMMQKYELVGKAQNKNANNLQH